MGRRNHLVRLRIAKIMVDGEWRTAAEIAIRFRSEGWSFTSTGQLGNLLSRSPGIIRRRTGGSTTVFTYRMNNPSAYDDFMQT